MMIKSFTRLGFIFLLISAFSCKKNTDSPAPSADPGSLRVFFDNRAGADPLVFGNSYVNANFDTLHFSMFNYFISNIKLTNEDGSVWTQTYDSSYYLIKHSDAGTRSFIIPGVPAENYTSISFIIGVDSAKSVSDISERTGVLDPGGDALGMYWQWNSGYIFMKVEGTSPQAPVNVMTGKRSFFYHIGGYGGFSTPAQNNIKQVTLNFPAEKAQVSASVTPEVHIVADILELFKTPTGISVAENPVVMDGKYAPFISANYSDMFSVDHVHND